MSVTVGHTPDADDAFMFYAMLEDKVDNPDGFAIDHVVEDIETLNKRALKNELDVTAVSAHTYAYLNDYTILRSGGSFGIGYGPIVVAKDEIPFSELKNKKIAIPGRYTSAFLLLQLMIGKYDYEEMRFDKVTEAVKNSQVDAGLVIHETQITYDKQNLHKILDVGEWWRDYTGGLPVPLGLNVMRDSFGEDSICKFSNYLKRSIIYGLDHLDEAVEYAMQYGRGQQRSLIQEFVKMYVNDYTVDMGVLGENSIKQLFNMGMQKGILDEFECKISKMQ